MSRVPPTDRSTKVPGRPYSFVATLLATFMLGLTVVTLCRIPPTSTPLPASESDKAPLTAEVARHDASPSPAAGDELSRERLGPLAGIALGIAVLSLIPSRKLQPQVVTPQLVAESTGLTVLGNFFAPSPESAAPTAKPTGRLLRASVSLAELVLIAAFTLSVAACFVQPDLVATFRQNPLAGYVESVRLVANTVQEWLPSSPPLA